MFSYLQEVDSLCRTTDIYQPGMSESLIEPGNSLCMRGGEIDMCMDIRMRMGEGHQSGHRYQDEGNQSGSLVCCCHWNDDIAEALRKREQIKKKASYQRKYTVLWSNIYQRCIKGFELAILYSFIQ